MKKALTVIEVMNFTEEEREAYEDHLKWLKIEANTLKKAEARAEGKAENKREIALAMLKEGLDVKLISKITNLTINEINKLKNTF